MLMHPDVAKALEAGNRAAMMELKRQMKGVPLTPGGITDDWTATDAGSVDVSLCVRAAILAFVKAMPENAITREPGYDAFDLWLPSRIRAELEKDA